MKSRAVFSALLMLSMGCQAPRPSRTTSVTAVVQQCLPSVVLLRVGPWRGSGVVLSWDGEVLTNNHMIRSGASYRIVTWSGRTYTAAVVRTDAAADLALLQITDLREILTPIRFCLTPPIIGESVVVIGNALGRGHIVTSGIISAVNQRVLIRGYIEFTGMIQSDAPINPGNSGGALLAVTGELLGVVNSACRADGVGWAIPMVAVRRFLRQ